MLGAQVEAHLQIRLQIAVFKCGVRNAEENTALARTPNEVIDMIEAHVRKTIFHEYQEDGGKLWTA